MMQTTRSKAVALSLLGLGLVVLGALYYFFVYQAEPETVVFHTYVCDDESFYFVRMDEGAIEVAGARYELVSEEGGMRYEGAGPLAFMINDSAFSVSFKESGEEIASCQQGTVENTPILEVGIYD